MTFWSTEPDYLWKSKQLLCLEKHGSLIVRRAVKEALNQIDKITLCLRVHVAYMMVCVIKHGP